MFLFTTVGLNVLCGVGILTTCFGIKQAGWLSLLLLPLLGACSCYTGLLLKRCIDSSPTIETYPDIGRAAFGTPGRIFVSVCIFTYCSPICTDLAKFTSLILLLMFLLQVVLYLELYVSVLSLNSGSIVF